jgi:hypothetical protein
LVWLLVRKADIAAMSGAIEIMIYAAGVRVRRAPSRLAAACEMIRELSPFADARHEENRPWLRRWLPGIACDLLCTPSVSREYFAAAHGRQGELPRLAATRPVNPMISLRAEISPALRRGLRASQPVGRCA